jgi:hypothetical protein
VKYQKRVRLDGDDLAVVDVKMPAAPARAAVAVDSPWPPDPAPRPTPAGYVCELRDLGTFLSRERWRGIPADVYRENMLEGPPVLTVDDDLRDARWFLDQLTTRELVSGERFDNCYPLQVNLDSTKTGAVVELVGARGGDRVAVSPETTPSIPWYAPPADAVQRETIERLREQQGELGANGVGPRGRVPSDGLERWSQLLDLKADRWWHPSTGARIDRPGRGYLRTVPGVYDLSLASDLTFEPWRIGDEHRYLCTLGDTFGAKEIDPARVWVNRRHAARSTIYAAPQRVRCTFHWLDAYMISIGWWAVILYFPNIKTFSIRGPFDPEYWTPRGTLITVGPQWSERIARTQAYARALLQSVNMGPYFIFLGRVQGRYGVRQENSLSRKLCANVRHHWLDGTHTDVRVFRRPDVEIERGNMLVETGGLYTQEVTPWVTNYFEDDDPKGSNNIADIF